MTNQILQIKNDLEESQRQSQNYSQTEKSLKEELEHSKAQFLDMQRAERTVRIDLEQIKRNVNLVFFCLFYFCLRDFNFNFNLKI